MTLDFSDVSTYLIDIGFALLVTVLLYLAVPIFLVFIRKKSFTQKEARMIAIINTVVVCIIFKILVVVIDGGLTGNITPAIVWGIVGYRILLKNEKSSDEADPNRGDYKYEPQPQIIQTSQNNSHQSKNTPNQQTDNSNQFSLFDDVGNDSASSKSNIAHSGLTYQEFEDVFFSIYQHISASKTICNIPNYSKFDVLSTMYFICEYDNTLPRDAHIKMTNTVRTAISKLFTYEKEDFDFEEIRKRVNLYRQVANDVLPLRTDFFLAEVNPSDYVLKSAVTLCNILINPDIIDDYNSASIITGLDEAITYTNFCYAITQFLTVLQSAIDKLKGSNSSEKTILGEKTTSTHNSQPTKKKNTPVIVLSLLLIVVVAVSTTMIVINYGKYDKLLRANEALVEESQDWQAKIAEERLESYNTIKNYQDKVWFLDENIVFVLDYDDVHYYTYDQMMEETKDIDDYTYWAFNVNAAKSRGYVSR